MPVSGSSISIPTADSLGMSGIFKGAYEGARYTINETVEQVHDLKAFAEAQTNNIDDAVEGLLSAAQLILPPVPSYGTTISLQGDLAELPAAPGEPTIAGLPSDFSVPDFEPAVGGGTIDTSDAPVFTATAPVISYPAQPAIGTTAGPGPAPELSLPAAPVEPSYALPEVPGLRSLNLPAVPTLNIPTFAATAPEYDIEEPETVFNWTDPAYQTTFVTALAAKLSDMLGGNLGLSAAIEAMIWEQARDRDGKVAFQAERETLEDFAARGFTLPTGALLRRLDAARQAKQDAAGETGRTIAIESAKLRIENVKFAVVQCSALEQLLWQIFNAGAQRQFEAAKAQLEFRISVFNALVSAFNAKQQAYRVEADVFKTRIEAELTRLETYKAELEGQKLIGELNQQDVEVYKARLTAVNVLADIFKSSVQAYSARVDAETKTIDAYRAQVEAYKTNVEAEGLAITSWGKLIDAETSKANLFEAQARAYSAEVQGYSSVKQLQIEGLKVANDSLGVQYQAYQAKLAHQSQMASQALQAIQANVSIYDSRIKRYLSELDLQKTEIGTDIERRRLEVQTFSTEVDKELKQVEYSITRAVKMADLAMEAAKAIAQVRSQLAAQAMGAVRADLHAGSNANLGASGTYGESKSLSA